MKLSTLALTLALFVPAASAQVAMERGGDKIVLTMERCPDNILALVKPQYQDRFKQALALIAGKPVGACWIVASDTSVVVVYEDGDATELPMAAFKSSPNI